MVITDEDYKVVIGENALDVLSRTSAENRASAEAEAQEEISGYLRPKYDCAAIFGASGRDRNKLIVMYMCDIALYNMCSSQPARMGMEIRRERYERAVRGLKEVAGGKVVPDLPPAVGSGVSSGAVISYGCKPKLHHDW